MTGKIIKIPSEKFLALTTEEQRELLLEKIRTCAKIDESGELTKSIREKENINPSLKNDIIFYMSLMQKKEINVTFVEDKVLRGNPLFSYDASGRLTNIMINNRVTQKQMLCAIVNCLEERFMPDLDKALKLKLI